MYACTMYVCVGIDIQRHTHMHTTFIKSKEIRQVGIV